MRSFGFEIKQLSCGTWEGCVYESLGGPSWFSTSFRAESLRDLFEQGEKLARRLWVRKEQAQGFTLVRRQEGDPLPSRDLNAVREFSFDWGEHDPSCWEEHEIYPDTVFDGAFYRTFERGGSEVYVQARQLEALFSKARDLAEALCKNGK